VALPDKTSLLSSFGQWLTPLFAPLGLQSDNWPATVGLFTGILAKEVVVGTLNTLYTEVGNLVAASPEQFNFWGGLQTALASVPANLKALTHAFANPILATAKNQVITNGVFGQMAQRFDGRIGAFAYLLFILLYVPCVSTMAVIMRELGKNWMLFSLFWNTSFAYGLAVIFYQTATFTRHATTSLCWITGILVFNILLVLCLRFFFTKKEALT
jgi:ferrous iron transport protein B